MRYALNKAQRYRLMFGTGLQQYRDDPAVVQMKADSFAPLRAALTEHFMSAGRDHGSGDIADMAMQAWAFVHGLAMLLIDGALDLSDPSGGGIDAFVERLVDRFTPGLAGQRAPGKGGIRQTGKR